MTSTFDCPHCEKTYPANPSLIGRKVRCSSCKNVFQLQSNGTARKVDLGVKKQEASKQQQSASHANVTRQLTRRTKGQVKNITRRLEKGRSALSEAARDAIESMQGDGESTAAPGAGQAAAKNSVSTENIKVHLSGSRGLNPKIKLSMYILLAICVCVIVTRLLISELPPEYRALEDYADTVDREFIQYPIRMDTYRQRTWVYSRDGVDLPPVIVDADKASIIDLGEVDWSEMIRICSEHIGGMSLMPAFGIMVSSDKLAMVEKMWESYDQKYDLARFFKLLHEQEIRFVYCKKIPELFANSGMSQRDIYITSLLLAGTRDRKGDPCYDFGLISTMTAEKAHVYEFRGQRGMELVERENEYSIIKTGPYCGLIVGFIDIQDQPDEWRVLDVRFGNSMDAFYERRYNPLVTLSTRAMISLKKSYANPAYENKGQEDGQGPGPGPGGSQQ